MSVGPDEEPHYRQASPDDALACNELMWSSVTDFGLRQGTPLEGTAADWWRGSEPLHRLLAEEAAEWWVAELPAGQIVGFARSIERDGLFELTEFFVGPNQQARGIGKGLLERAFPAGRGRVRSIIATSDVRAQARYYAAGTVARFPLFTLGGVPGTGSGHDLTVESIDGVEAIQAQRRIERSVLGHRRSESEIRWLLDRRRGHLYRRDDRYVGFSFLGADGTGPMAALDSSDLPAILAHVEGVARSMGVERLELQLPGPNEVGIRHLLARGFRFDRWINLLMSDRPFGHFDRFIPFSPPLFL
jgi:GNAT superfamily N-acetyltransferase